MSNQTNTQKQIIDAFQFRHATKYFDKNKKISDNEFETLLETARLSPSSFGFEPWQILVVQSPEKRELFRDFTWGANGAFHGTDGQLGSASHFVIFLAHTEKTMKHHSDYQQKHLKEVKCLPDDVVAFMNQAFEKFQEQDFNLKTDRDITDWSGKQAYIALGNMMTGAALLGIDSCPIEGFDMTKTIAVLEKEFGIDTSVYQPCVMAAFGYRTESPKHTQTRRKMDDVVRWY